MFKEWICKNNKSKEDISIQIIQSLRNIRELRQKPAHELTSNMYDISLYQKQEDLMNETYTAIRAIRLFFANHPSTKDVVIPENLISGKGIVSY